MTQNKNYWSSIATKYDDTVKETGDQSQQLVINPKVEEMLGDLHGKVVLDAGCGNGYWARRMAQTAERVVGVDFTDQLIERARGRGVPSNTEFIIGNLENLLLADDTFDVVLMNMVVLDLENLQMVIHEIGRVTKAGGKVVVSTVHPCFENPPNTHSLRDSQGNKTGRVTSNYFKTGLIVDEANNYQHWHYKLSDLINTFATYNLFAEKMIEPDGSDSFKSNGEDHHPYFLITKFRKVK